MVFPHAIFYFFQFWLRLAWLGLLLLVFGCFFILIFAANLGTTGWKVAGLVLVTLGIAVLIFWGMHYVYGLAAIFGISLPQTAPDFLLGPGFGMGLLLSQLLHSSLLQVFDCLSPALGPGMLIPAPILWWSAFNLIGLRNHLSTRFFNWIGLVMWFFGPKCFLYFASSRFPVMQAHINWVFFDLLTAEIWAWAWNLMKTYGRLTNGLSWEWPKGPILFDAWPTRFVRLDCDSSMWPSFNRRHEYGVQIHSRCPPTAIKTCCRCGLFWSGVGGPFTCYFLLWAAMFSRLLKAHPRGSLHLQIKGPICLGSSAIVLFNWACSIVSLEKDIVPTRIVYFSWHDMVFIFDGTRSMFRVTKCYGGVCPSKKYM